MKSTPYQISEVLKEVRVAHTWWSDTWQRIKVPLSEGRLLRVNIAKETRTLEQNSIMWSILTDLSRQLEWPVNGRLQRLAPEEWKDILTAGLTKEQRVAQSLDGNGWVMLGERTSRMSIEQLSDLITLAYAFGAGKNVRWSRTSLGRDVPKEACA